MFARADSRYGPAMQPSALLARRLLVHAPLVTAALALAWLGGARFSMANGTGWVEGAPKPLATAPARNPAVARGGERTHVVYRRIAGGIGHVVFMDDQAPSGGS